MRELTDPMEIEQHKEELLNARTSEQKQNADYDYDAEGNIEYCECGRALNSHGHCPRCDYLP